MSNDKFWVLEDPEKKYNLEDRLIQFACLSLEICDLLPNTKGAQNLVYQLSKSGTASALIYGEVQAAESRGDFLHKMKCVLKELRESHVNLKIIKLKPVIIHPKVDEAIAESGELVAIFITSIKTATDNGKAELLKKKTSPKKPGE